MGMTSDCSGMRPREIDFRFLRRSGAPSNVLDGVLTKIF